MSILNNDSNYYYNNNLVLVVLHEYVFQQAVKNKNRYIRFIQYYGHLILKIQQMMLSFLYCYQKTNTNK